MFLNHSFILFATNEIAMTQKNNCKLTATCDSSLDVCFSSDCSVSLLSLILVTVHPRGSPGWLADQSSRALWETSNPHPSNRIHRCSFRWSQNIDVCIMTLSPNDQTFIQVSQSHKPALTAEMGRWTFQTYLNNWKSTPIIWSAWSERSWSLSQLISTLAI